MPSFTITKNGKTYEFSIPEPEYEVPENVLEKMKDYDTGIDYNPFCVMAMFDSSDIIDAYMKYVISQLWDKEECERVEELIDEYTTAYGETPEYVEDFVDWNDVWSTCVVDELPKASDIADNECLLALREIRIEIDEEERRVKEEKQRQENKAILERKIAEREALLARLMREKEEMETLVKQYD